MTQKLPLNVYWGIAISLNCIFRDGSIVLGPYGAFMVTTRFNRREHNQNVDFLSKKGLMDTVDEMHIELRLNNITMDMGTLPIPR